MQTYNRLPHILNRNISKTNRILKEEINSAFTRRDYNFLRQTERVVFSKFIKEMEIEDIDAVLEAYNFKKEDIKRLYETSPYRNSLLSKEWDEYFELETVYKKVRTKRKPSTITKAILVKKGININEL